MDIRSRPAVGTSGPGTDPASLRLITVAVLAGLVVSGIVVVSRHGHGPGGTVVRPVRSETGRLAHRAPARPGRAGLPHDDLRGGGGAERARRARARGLGGER